MSIGVVSIALMTCPGDSGTNLYQATIRTQVDSCHIQPYVIHSGSNTYAEPAQWQAKSDKIEARLKQFVGASGRPGGSWVATVGGAAWEQYLGAVLGGSEHGAEGFACCNPAN